MRFVTVGTSPITETFIRGARHVPDFELYGVCSRSIGRAESFAVGYGARRAFCRLEDVASDPCVDAVYIASPNSLHARQSKLMLCAGKAVLCEKPSASNVKELESVIETSRRCGVLFMEAYMSMFMPNYILFKKTVSELGRIKRAAFSFCHYSSRYDAYKRGEDVNTFKPEFSNGAVMDMGPYCIYPAVDMFGYPIDIKAESELMPTGVDAESRAVLSYDGFDVHIRCAKTFTAAPEFFAEGSSGRVSVDSPNIPSRVTLLRGEISKDISVPQFRDHMYYETCEFIRLFLSGKTESDKNTHALSLSVLRIIDEIRRQTGIVFPADLQNDVMNIN